LVKFSWIDNQIDVSNIYAGSAWSSLSEVVVGRRRQLPDQSVSADSSPEPSTSVSGLVTVTSDSEVVAKCLLTRYELYIAVELYATWCIDTRVARRET
jgi:hypothetical protein